MEIDLTSSVDPVLALGVGAITSDTATNGSILDSKGFESLDVVLAGVITDGSYVVSIVEGDEVDDVDAPTTITDAAAVDASFIIGALPSLVAVTGQSISHFGYVGKKRYQQITVTSTVTTTGGIFTAVATKGHAKSRPTV